MSLRPKWARSAATVELTVRCVCVLFQDTEGVIACELLAIGAEQVDNFQSKSPGHFLMTGALF